MYPSENQGLAGLVARVIRQRQTFKVLADPASPFSIGESRLNHCDSVVAEAIRTSAWAPFHYDRGVDGLAEPWRVDWIKYDDCRVIAKELPNWFDDVKPSNKLPAMLAACGSLVLVSWLPQFCRDAEAIKGPERESQWQTDEEHLAATSAYVQNLLLLLTANGLGTYWSSGGQFRERKMFEQLRLPHQGRLLAAVFVDYSEGSPDAIEVAGTGEADSLERLTGKHRDRRCPDAKWLHHVSLR